MKKKHTKPTHPTFEILQCPYCGVKTLHPESLTMCCSKAIMNTLKGVTARP